MLACEADETWTTLRNLRPEAKQKLLSAVCILVQEVVKDNGLSFKNKAKGWREDEPDACQLHRTMYNMLVRHIMGITAAQFVWQPEDTEGEEERVNSGATSSGEHRPEEQQVEGGDAAEADTTSPAPTAGTRKRIRHKSTQ